MTISIKDQLNNHLFIVLGYEHYTPLGVVRSIGEYGIKPIGIIIRNKKNVIVSASKYLSQCIYVKTEEEQLNVLINNFGNEKCKPFVFPCDDKITELIDHNYSKLSSKFYISNAKTENAISNYLIKQNIYALAQKNGLKVAKTWDVKKGDIPEDIVFPVITKTISSNEGGWKEDYYICENRKELTDAYLKIKSNKIFLQSYIKKINELCLDGFSLSGGRNVIYAISSRYTYVLPDNYSAKMVVRNFSNEPKYQETKKALDSMFKEIGYEGIFSVEFMIDENEELWFLEINFRSSTWNYAATSLGMNMPILWAKGMIYNNISENCIKQIPLNYKAIAELPDFGWRVMKRKISFVNWIRELIECNCFYFYNKNDLKPFFYAVFWKVENKLEKIFNKVFLRKKYRW